MHSLGELRKKDFLSFSYVLTLHMLGMDTK